MYKYHLVKAFLLALVFFSSNLLASTLQDVKFLELPGEGAEVRLVFDSSPVKPVGYTIDRPARIVFDFADVVNGLNQKKYAVNVGSVQSAVVVEGGGRTRVIVNLDGILPYNTRVEGNEVIVSVGSEVLGVGGSTASTSTSVINDTPTSTAASSTKGKTAGINNIDFRRGELGEGKVIISLAVPGVAADVEEVASGINVRFIGTSLPNELRRKLDVIDFATPVTMVSASASGHDAIISVKASGDYDYLAYQADGEYVISVKPLTKAEQEEKQKQFAYVGERLSLNFQSIEVRSVLQLIADFTDMNLVASDTVTGSITLRLENVPWDQALDIVLKTKGLDKRLSGNVLVVAPAAEIAARERTEIETKKQLEELAPLRTEYIRIRYANATELFNLFIDSTGNGNGSNAGGGAGGSASGTSTGSILSNRGHAIVDERTNSIILTDTEEKITSFKKLVDTIDVPIRQVMIEARIVIANTDFSRELGSRISAGAVSTSSGGNNLFELAGNRDALEDGRVLDDDALIDDGIVSITASDVVDLAVFDPAGALTLNILSSDFLLGLELSALEGAGYGEVVSQPKVITGDKQQASIQSGSEVPYREESASGGATIAFKEATLKLDVTPQITPDNNVIIDLIVNQDTVGAVDETTGVPLIDITQLETQVLVADGETIVLGGIYQTSFVTSQSKVPFLGDIPYLGRLFRNDSKSEEKNELLIFITPRIMANKLID